MHSLDTVAPAFVEMAHRIVWCVVGTTDADGGPRTRVLHPIWEWDGEHADRLDRHVAQLAEGGRPVGHAEVSITYWAPNHDTCTADCDAGVRAPTPAERAAGWERFADGPSPVGYDPAIIPGWDEPGVARLRDPPADTAPPAGDARHGDAARVRARLLTWRA